jgi:hypothetical protein
MKQLKLFKMQSNYQRFTKLCQEYFLLIVLLALLHREIRAKTILKYLDAKYQTKITKSWINQIIRREEIKRPLGRPKNSYYEKEPYYLDCIDVLHKRIRNFGISLMQDIMHYLGIEDMFIDLLPEVNKEFIQKEQRPFWKNTYSEMIQTLTAISLYPGVNNFEEACNANIPHMPMMAQTARNHIKRLEACHNLPELLSRMHRELWAKFLNLIGEEIIIFIDGHVKTYYTKQTHVCGLISVLQKIMPGTKYVIATTSKGYLLDMLNIQVDTPYGQAVIKMTLEIGWTIGKPIKLVIMDREGSGQELNNHLKNIVGISTLTPLRSNQYKSLEDFECKKIDNDLYVGNWRDKKKFEKDNRTLIIIDYKNRLCVFATNEEKIDYSDTQSLYKKRWPYNEEKMKHLNMLTGFNTNICNGVTEIPDPKHVRTEQELDKKIEEAQEKKDQYKTKEEEATARSVIKKQQEQQKNVEQRIEKYENQKNELGEIKSKKIREVVPDYFVSMLKLNIVNSFQWLLESCLPSNEKNPAMEKMYQMLMNMEADLFENTEIKKYILSNPCRKSDRKLLKIFCENFNKLHIKSRAGKKIILEMERLPP